MKLKLLFALLAVMFAAYLPVSAQDELEVTQTPIIWCDEYEDQVVVYIACDEEAVIYASVDGMSVFEVNEALAFNRTDEEQVFEVTAFAQAEGKAPSETVTQIVVVEPKIPEPTVTPYVYYTCEDGSYWVTIESPDPDADIYYRIRYNDGEYSEWMPYVGEIWFSESGFYIVEAFAIAAGKAQSDITGVQFYIDENDFDYTRVYDFKVDGIYYKILDSSTVAVSKQYIYRYGHSFYYIGDQVWLYGTNYRAYTGEVTIPETVEYRGTTYTVTAIADEAFWECRVTSVTIPSTVTSIGKYAFGRTSLASMELPSRLTTIGEAAFAGCTSLASVNIPAGVTSLGDYAFARCTNLANLSMSGSFSAIGKNAFSNCAELTGVNIPAGVTTIGERAFYNCKKMTQVSLPASVTTIGDDAFSGCTRMTGVTMPAALNTLGNSAFMNCVGLTKIVIPEGATAIGNSAFSGCSGVTSLSLPTTLTTIGGAAFSRCYGLTQVVIPESVTTLGHSAFYGCRSLTAITLPAALTAINYSTFMNCAALTGIELPSTLTSIGYDAFNGCAGLTALTIPAPVTNIEERAFDDCSSLTSIQVESGNTVFDSRGGCNAIIKTAGNVLQLGCMNTVVPATVTAIGDHAFYNCGGLTAVSLPEGLKSIGSHAFYNCKGLTEVTLPATVDTVRTDAFYCAGLTAVTCLADVPPVTYSRTFMTCYDATLRVPQSSVDDYKSAEYWREFSRIMSTTDPAVGDLDGDGVIGVSDITLLMDYILDPETEIYLACADVDNDGKIGVSDITALVDMLLNQ